VWYPCVCQDLIPREELVFSSDLVIVRLIPFRLPFGELSWEDFPLPASSAVWPFHMGGCSFPPEGLVLGLDFRIGFGFSTGPGPVCQLSGLFRYNLSVGMQMSLIYSMSWAQFQIFKFERSAAPKKNKNGKKSNEIIYSFGFFFHMDSWD